MRCSFDLRKRVVDFVKGGGSKAEAARRFNVGEASVYRWLKHGGLKHRRPGPQKSHKLDWDGLRRHVENHDGLTQAERARHFGVSRFCIWNALQKMELTRKKSLSRAPTRDDGVQRAQSYEKKKLSTPS